MGFRVWVALAAAAWLGAETAMAQDIARVVAVSPGAEIVRQGHQATVGQGQGVASGDVIVTDRRGQVQLLFDDETRVAIGPNSQFNVTDVRLNAHGTAKTFAVAAVAGTFRFITGKSRKSAYAIDTPTATMGIRGTAFDFVVRRREGTDLILFSGQVRMCGRTGGCYKVGGVCDAVQMDQQGTLGLLTSRDAKRDLIARGFFFISDENQLRPEFRTALRSCGRDVVARVPQRKGDAAPRAPSPPSPPGPPGPPGPPDPPPDDPPDPVI